MNEEDYSKLSKREAKRLLKEKKRELRKLKIEQAHAEQALEEAERHLREARAKMDQDEFFEHAMQPGFPNKFAIELRAMDPDPGKTFSMDGLESVGEQMLRFVGARVAGTWRETGKAPRILRIAVALSFDDDPTAVIPIEESALPYFKLETDEGLSVIDGLRRIKPPKRPS